MWGGVAAQARVSSPMRRSLGSPPRRGGAAGSTTKKKKKKKLKKRRPRGGGADIAPDPWRGARVQKVASAKVIQRCVFPRISARFHFLHTEKKSAREKKRFEFCKDRLRTQHSLITAGFSGMETGGGGCAPRFATSVRPSVRSSSSSSSASPRSASRRSGCSCSRTQHQKKNLQLRELPLINRARRQSQRWCRRC